MKTTLTYKYKDNLYINLTSKCPTACSFCIKFSWKGEYRNYYLLHNKDPEVADIIEDARKKLNPKIKEIVYCGYGESTYRLKEMKEVYEGLKNGSLKFRLNTIGLGNLINGKDITPFLGEFLDCVSISLNTINKNQWLKLMRPLPEFKDYAFESVIEFIKLAKKNIKDVVITAVHLKDVDIEAIRKFAKEIGVKFKLRRFLS
ncbi:MAG: TatD family nuclease-associated radical SAM protein [bacterium]|nr:TatD family nuclease-associated radical SAM protein [bacterium]